MTTSFRPLDIRKRLGKDDWEVPRQFFDGWVFDRFDGSSRIIITCGPAPDDPQGDNSVDNWFHASISRREVMPSYDDLALLHHAVWPDGYAYQVFAPPSAHINIHPYALHLWGRPDGAIVLPNFGAMGTI